MSIEAMKQELEALEHFYSYGFDRVTCEKAIVAIKESLPPPQRQWVGLTDDEVQDIYDNALDVIRTTEAKLKAKNFAEEKNT